jgi:hypothetical protein
MIAPVNKEEGAQWLIRFARVFSWFAAINVEESREWEIRRCGSQPSGKGPADYFTGTVRIDPLFEAPEPARVRRK